MHREIYRLRPDVNAIVHTHSPFATAYAAAGRDIVSGSLAECNLVLGKVPCVPYGRPGTADVYARFPEYLEEYNAILLAGHGPVTFGPDLTTAFSLTEMVEKIAKIVLLTQFLGGEQKLPPEELEELRRNGSLLRHQEMERRD